MRRLISAVAVASLALAVSAVPAGADSIAYVGSDGNLHLVSPDGSVHKQVTNDASAENAYRSPSQQNDGTVVGLRNVGSTSAFAFFFDPKSGKMTTNWLLPPASGPLSFSPFTGGQISPDGGMMVYDYFYGPGAINPGSAYVGVGFVAGPGLTSPCTINCEQGYAMPRWVPGTPYAAFLDVSQYGSSQDRVAVQAQGGTQIWIALDDPNAGDLESFDISAQGRTLVEVTPEGVPDQDAGDTPEPSELFVLTNQGTPPAGDVTVDCTIAGFATLYAGALPRWSPDGTMIAWQGAEGVYVSPTPPEKGGGTCTLKPKLVAPGGRAPAWGPASVQGGGGAALSCDEAKAKVAKAKKKLKKAKKKLKSAKARGDRAKVKKAKKKVKKAKKKVKKAKAAKKRACG